MNQDQKPQADVNVNVNVEKPDAVKPNDVPPQPDPAAPKTVHDILGKVETERQEHTTNPTKE